MTGHLTFKAAVLFLINHPVSKLETVMSHTLMTVNVCVYFISYLFIYLFFLTVCVTNVYVVLNLMKPKLTEKIFNYYSFSFGSYWKRLCSRNTGITCQQQTFQLWLLIEYFVLLCNATLLAMQLEVGLNIVGVLSYTHMLTKKCLIKGSAF